MSDPQSSGAPQRAHTPAGTKAGTNCPICGRPTEPATRPFCSKRCADIDLSRWLGGVYRIESPENQENPADPAGSDPDERV
ncbi:hypothetical protein AZL_d03700 (plasmid) [Azospirillum sp. B510]|uniref:DNA gyrase inhibitor YacG n=1 Tax=Azospirillum sp. (strain B510) TaxID=137722 RepID=UPI0001C4C797|nr:hypothetical protein AZL_d03700 [Azospirillum sp. B510]